MNELRQQINSQLKANGVSQGLNYKSFSNQAPDQNKLSYNTSTKVSNKNIVSIKSSKVGIATKKRTVAQDQQMSQVVGNSESLQMKINKKRIQSSTKHPGVEGNQQQILGEQPTVPGHHRIVSNPVSFNHENLA